MTDQQHQDRVDYLDAQRAAHTAGLHAAFYENLAAQVIPDPALGWYAEQAATELRRGYVAISLKLLDVQREAQERADAYAALLLGGVA